VTLIKTFYAVSRASPIYLLSAEQQHKNIRKEWFSTISHIQPGEGYMQRIRDT